MQITKHNNDSATDRNISLVSGWNLIGYSAEEVNLSLADATFTNSSGTKFTWASAIANNSLQAYLAYYDSSSATASQRKYKYTGTSGVDDAAFRNNRGYWLKSNQAGNLTLPSVGGTWSNETYDWAKLRFSNSSGSEYGIGDVGSAGLGLNWIETTFQYWDSGGEDFDLICGTTGAPNFCDKTNISPWEGVFIKSLQDNITIIRQN